MCRLGFQITRSPDHQIIRSPDLQVVTHSDTIFPAVSRKPALIKIINLEQGMPTVEQARLRMEHEVQVARQSGYRAVKLVHGYGSSGVGGALRVELQKQLRLAAQNGGIPALISGGGWRLSHETTLALLKRFPPGEQDTDFGRNNQGIPILGLLQGGSWGL